MKFSKQLTRQLTSNLIINKQLKTTLAKCKYIQPVVEKMITSVKKGNILKLRKYLTHKNCLVELVKLSQFDRNGGYTRIIKFGYRFGDSAKLAVIEFTDRFKL